jgi:hypothetical protein
VSSIDADAANGWRRQEQFVKDLLLDVQGDARARLAGI